MTGHVHVVGAGIAGLAAAERLSAVGVQVTLWEATGKAGGRCRSYPDAQIGRQIDNGNHLILSGNRAVLDHAARIGAANLLAVQPPLLPFADLETGTRWELRLPRTPLGLLRAGARPPGSRAVDVASGLALLAPRAGTTVAQAIRDRGPVWRALWEPLTVAVLNAPPERADAGLLAAVLRRTLLRGARASSPVLAPGGLGPALVDPAVALLQQRGVAIHYRQPLSGLDRREDRVTGLRFETVAVPVAPADAVILALPSGALRTILPDLTLPEDGATILNAHFRVRPEVARRMPPVLGVLGGRVQWLFRRGDVVSATISAVAADRRHQFDAETLWPEIARILDTAQAPVGSRILRERAATFDQSPVGVAARAATRQREANLFLAGDHVATGLPATLEGAVRSAEAAAQAALDRLGRRPARATGPAVAAPAPTRAAPDPQRS